MLALTPWEERHVRNQRTRGRANLVFTVSVLSALTILLLYIAALALLKRDLLAAGLTISDLQAATGRHPRALTAKEAQLLGDVETAILHIFPVALVLFAPVIIWIDDRERALRAKLDGRLRELGELPEVTGPP